MIMYCLCFTCVFTSINAIWPGSTHDAHVFRTSELFHFMETHHHGLEDGILLGDSAYPCKPYMLTPYLHPANEAQQHFNDAHCSTRNVIERAFGVLKRRFHILHTEIRMKPLKVSKIVVCCVVLHNLAKLWGEPDEFPPEDDQQPPTVLNHDDDMSGKAVREYITMQYFSYNSDAYKQIPIADSDADDPGMPLKAGVPFISCIIAKVVSSGTGRWLTPTSLPGVGIFFGNDTLGTAHHLSMFFLE
ncbi:HARB1-like protein [Mya arenaria]|uniref:HARB1-like protein n=1 Tax=Mya arenaria TaxID=6604 RepID=A0ABY7F719_MYAAR|nr:HARB1-like protein [Mya arenaria]